MRYGEALDLLLKQQGINRFSLSKAIGKSSTYISQLINGKIKEPSLSTSFAIADALGVTVQDFIDLMIEEG